MIVVILVVIIIKWCIFKLMTSTVIIMYIWGGDYFDNANYYIIIIMMYKNYIFQVMMRIAILTLCLLLQTCSAQEEYLLCKNKNCLIIICKTNTKK